MKRVIVLLMAVGFLAILSTPGESGMTYKQFKKMKAGVETPKLIPKGGVKAKRLTRKDIEVMEEENAKLDLREHLLFKYGLAELRDDGNNESNLEEIADYVKEKAEEDSEIVFYVDGHTCSIGPAEFNCRLSWDRASTIVKELEDRGVDSSNLEKRGYGENEPSESNDREESRKKNRRVEMSSLQGGEEDEDESPRLCDDGDSKDRDRYSRDEDEEVEAKGHRSPFKEVPLNKSSKRKKSMREKKAGSTQAAKGKKSPFATVPNKERGSRTPKRPFKEVR
ncbi:OmpA family protein [Thermodesulfobacteriota bacterium]